MPKYVDVEVLKAQDFQDYSNTDVEYAIDHCPPAAVAPYESAEWTDNEYCSNCGLYVTEGLDAEIWDFWYPQYCPHCGSFMKNGVSY